MTQTEALKLALEALEKLTNAAEGFSVSGVYFNEERWARKCLDDAYDAMGFAQEALAQPEQEPVAFLTNRRQRLNVEFNATGLILMPKSVDWKIPLYTTPPQPKEPEQEPVDLECYDAGLLGSGGGGDVDWWQDYIRAELGRAHEHYQSQITTPPQRKPMTDEQRLIEMVDAAMVATRDIVPRITRSQCRLIIEAAHGIKGEA